MPILGDRNHDSIVYSLKHRAPKILKLGTPSQPRAIILVTAHWSTATPTISSGEKHELYYDYYGFPEEAYHLKYPAPGSPSVAQEVKQALEEAGLQPKLDAKRGWDHGVFIPLSLAIPKADIPVVQLSVLASEDAVTHMRMGQALARLRESNVAIIGSGFASFHNLGMMRRLMMGGSGEKKAFREVSEAWNGALTKAAERPEELKGWRAFPNADIMHPRNGGEHFMPLLVCAGAAREGEVTRRYADEFVGVEINTYYWGGDEVA